ncbi:AIPR family protein [Hankyongella ginsenosidimutans]|uniref:AIPR family protein n=1 Tax=Hankyongella ginsenosidimutans TaxID=1763828 RepID=UPI003CCC63B8
MSLSQLAALHKLHDKALYERNIRNFLGKTTDVNRAIRDTLTEKPELFQYLNNGVTALCERIEPKNGTAKEKVFSLGGVSIVNGAQTVAVTCSPEM